MLIKKENKKYLYLILILGFTASVLYSFRTLCDPDAFWHIATGKYIISTHSIPRTDPFSWIGIENNLKWINHEWLFDTIIYCIYLAGGIIGVNWFTALFAGILFLLIYKLCSIKTKNELISVIFSFICVLGVNPYINPRPQIMSYCLLVLAAIFLEKKKWWYVLPIIILGVNLHGGFYPMYVLLVVFYAWKEKIILIPLAILVAAINPYSFDMILYPFKIQQYPYFNQYISEWKHTILANPGIRFEFVTYIFLLVGISGEKIKISDGILSLLITIQTFMAFRNIVFLYVLIIPILSPYLNEKIMYLYNLISKKAHQEIRQKIILFMMLFIFSVMIGCSAALVKSKPAIDSNCPEKAVQYLKDNYITHFFNMYGDGGYIIFEGLQPMIDGRADIFINYYNSYDYFLEYMKAVYLENSPMNFINKYNIKYLLVNKSFPVYKFLMATNKFKVIYNDEGYSVLKLSYKNNLKNTK